MELSDKDKNRGNDNRAFESDDTVEQRTNYTTNEKKQTDLQELEDCSFFCASFECLNVFRNPKWFLVFLCFAAFMQGLGINGFVNVVITTIERRFGLSSTQSGTVASTYDIGSMIIMIPVSFLGGRPGASKPRWIGFGLICMGLGSMVWTLPHFSTPVYTVSGDTGGSGGHETSLCHTDNNTNTCHNDDTSTRTSLAAYRFVFVLAQLLHGFGATPLLVLGTTFLDQSVAVKNSSVYIGIFQTWFIIGPAIGYILGGRLLSIHTDLLTDTGLSPLSSQWVGAWWPGFLITFLGATLSGLVILCYPPIINNKYNQQESPQKTENNNRSLYSDLREALGTTLTNPTFIFLSLAVSMDTLLVAGLSAFLPKYVESQFKISAGLSAQLVGILVVPAGATATFLGGYLVKKLRLTRKKILIFCCIIQAVNIPFALQFQLYCPTLNYVGLNFPNNGTVLTTILPQFNHQCNQECFCNDHQPDPVCGSDGLMYLSPCHAGCSMLQGRSNFTNCDCITDGVSTALRTKCDDDCGYFSVFLALLFISIFLGFILSLPNTAAVLRCVHVDNRSMAIGVHAIIARLVGGIPGPIMFGYFIDKTCMYLNITCDTAGDGSCLVYDNKQFAVFMTSVWTVMKIVSLIFYGLSLFASKHSSVPDVTF